MAISQNDLQTQRTAEALPPLVGRPVSISPDEQAASAKAAQAAAVNAASLLPESAATKELLGIMQGASDVTGAYRVAIANAMESAAALEVQLLGIRQKMLTSRMTEADNDMRVRLQAVLMPTNGVLSRFEQIHQHLAAIEDGLAQLDLSTAQALDWARQTDYLPPGE